MPQRLIRFLSLLSLLLSLFIVACNPTQTNKTDKLEQVPAGADFFMSGVKRKVYDDSGRVTSKISAKQVQAYHKNQNSVWTQLEYLFERDGARWQLQADEGELQHNATMTLSENIELKKFSSDKNIDFILSTEELTLDFEQSLLTGNHPIIVRFDQGEFAGEKLLVNLNNNELNLTNLRGYVDHD